MSRIRDRRDDLGSRTLSMQGVVCAACRFLTPRVALSRSAAGRVAKGPRPRNAMGDDTFLSSCSSATTPRQIGLPRNVVSMPLTDVGNSSWTRSRDHKRGRGRLIVAELQGGDDQVHPKDDPRSVDELIWSDWPDGGTGGWSRLSGRNWRQIRSDGSPSRRLRSSATPPFTRCWSPYEIGGMSMRDCSGKRSMPGLPARK
jgi:hypothetical protein